MEIFDKLSLVHAVFVDDFGQRSKKKVLALGPEPERMLNRMTRELKGYFIPTHWNWITLEGPDARDFLQRLSTANLKKLGEGQGVPACFLGPTGKIIVTFTLWNCGQDTYAFEFEAGEDGRWRKNLLGFIDQFTFREKITVKEHPELKPFWVFGDEWAHPAGERVYRHSEQVYGTSWISYWGTEQPRTQLKLLSEQEIEIARINQMSPRAGREILESALPLEVGLASSVAPNKGCYPGQEVIEKILTYGAPPRRLCKVKGNGEPPPEVTSWYKQGDDFVGLELVNKNQAVKDSGRILDVTTYK